MGRHIQFADLSVEEFRKMAGLHLAALDHAVANIPPEQLTCRSPKSSTWSSRPAPRVFPSKPPTRDTRTSGGWSSA
jgi:hypothetical protein